VAVELEFTLPANRQSLEVPAGAAFALLRTPVLLHIFAEPAARVANTTKKLLE
jgi:hypothetical protein